MSNGRLNGSSLLKNFSVAVISQGIAMLVSVVSSLLVPRVLSGEGFGYWQLFLFYATYVGFLSFGQIDGVYLIYGGITREEIDKRVINSQFIVAIAVQLVCFLLICLVVPLCGFEPQRSMVMILTGAYALIYNLACFLGFLFQGMNETKRYSISVALSRIVFAVPLLLFVVLGTDRFEAYVIAYTLGAVAQLGFCLYFARDFITAGHLPWKEAWQESTHTMRVGAKLMFANVASMLTIGAARFVIDAVWGIETFGELSLSLSIVNLFLIFVNQASMVLFPALRQVDKDEMGKFLGKARTLMGLVLPAGYLLYYPLVFVLSKWLPQYADSFVFLVYLLPLCLFDSEMDVVGNTYFKVCRKERHLFILNVVTTALSATGAVVGALVFRSPAMAIMSAVVAIALRSVYANHVIGKEMSLAPPLMVAGEIALSILFVAVNLCCSAPIALAVYATAYLCYAGVMLVLRNRASAPAA